MSAALSDELRAQLNLLREHGVEDSLPFLVTVAADVPTADLPFVVELEVAAIRLVTGHMSAKQALSLADRPDVERIEYDGQASALTALARRSLKA